MPDDFPALFDSLLVFAGLVLVATGLVMFVRSKTSTQTSSVEAFGIKLNVTHPSLILVLAGVGLMLAPRLLPEPTGQADPQKAAVVAEAVKPPTTEPTAVVTPSPAVPAPPAPAPNMATPLPRQPAKPVVALPATLSPAASVRPVPSRKPPARASSVPEKTTAQRTAVRPALTASSAAPQHDEETPPSAAAQPAHPTLAYAALGLPTHRNFWNGETRAGYTRRLHATLQQAGRNVLHAETRGMALDPAEFDRWWNESGQFPRSRALCAAPPGPLALLAARVETPTVYSSIESAFWPELKLKLFVCANQRLYRQQKTLSPQNGDAWPFSTELSIEIEQFLRTYRADLAGN